MKTKTIWCGIDVSKETMTVSVDLFPDKDARHNPAHTFSRCQKGVAEMDKWIKRQLAKQNLKKCNYRLVMEATGKFSYELWLWIHDMFPETLPAILNPRLVKNFIQSLGAQQKTDDLDAKYIARMGTERKPVPSPLPTTEIKILQDLIRNRDAMVTQRAAIMLRQNTLDPKSFAYELNESVIIKMNQAIKQYEHEIAQHIKLHPTLSEAIRILSTIPGIAMINAATIISEVGMFSEEFSATQVSGFSGLAPKLYHSGTSVKKSKISKQGSPLLRKVLFLASNHAIKKITALHELYGRIIRKGASKMTAKCACMRKLLLIGRSMVINGTDFDSNYKAKRQRSA